MLGPTLKGKLIHLEPVRVEDVSLWSAWFADTTITQYLLARFAPSLRESQERFHNLSGDPDLYWWRLVQGGRTIGSTLLRDIDWQNKHAESALFIGDRNAWGHGYATDAVRLRTAFAFGELNLERLECDSYAENVAMHRALERNGYRSFARRRRFAFRDGVWHDLIMFELLRQEWDAAKHRDALSRTGEGT